MTIANVANSATWQLWATATNQMVTIVNEMIAGQLLIQTLNVAGNVSVTNNVVANFVELQGNDVGQELTDIWMIANGNLLLVNTMGSLANAGGVIANGAYTASNGFFGVANAAFTEANTIETVGIAAFRTANGANNVYNDVFANADTAWVCGSMENRIYNGRMEIDQQLEGGIYTCAGSQEVSFTSLDGWQHYVNDTSSVGLGFQIARGGPQNPPQGGTAKNYLQVTAIQNNDFSQINTAIAMTTQIDAVDLIDLLYGTANAQNLMLTFWAYTNNAGAYSVSLYSYNGFNFPARSLFQNYTLPANTWTYVVLSIPGDTNNQFFMTETQATRGMEIVWSLGVSQDFQANNNGGVPNVPLGQWSTFQPSYSGTGGYRVGYANTVNVLANYGGYWAMTDVRLRVGTYDVPHIPRPFQDELNLCKRYFQKSQNYGIPPLQPYWAALPLAIPTWLFLSVGGGPFCGYYYPLQFEVEFSYNPLFQWQPTNTNYQNPNVILYSYDGLANHVQTSLTSGALNIDAPATAYAISRQIMLFNNPNSGAGQGWIGGFVFNYVAYTPQYEFFQPYPPILGNP